MYVSLEGLGEPCSDGSKAIQPDKDAWYQYNDSRTSKRDSDWFWVIPPPWEVGGGGAMIRTENSLYRSMLGSALSCCMLYCIH